MNQAISEVRLINAELKQIKKRLTKIQESFPSMSVSNRLIDSPKIHIDKCTSDLDTVIKFEERGN